MIRNDELVLNNFSGVDHYIELMPAIINNTETFQGSTSPYQNMSATFGKWALIESEVVPVQEVMQKYNWTQTALHYHILNVNHQMCYFCIGQ
jgi:hypothetical protein